MEKRNPYLSIIATFRNDDFEGGGSLRFQTVVTNLIEQAKKYNVRAELIIVEWNPVPNNPSLKDALLLPSDLGPVDVRFIVVPPLIHKRYRCSDKIGIVYAAAQNVAIRRARGEFILPISADILLSNELMHFFSKEGLEKGCFYKIFHYNVQRGVMKSPSLEERMDFCKNNITSSCAQSKDASLPWLVKRPILKADFGGYVLFSKEHWHLVRGYPELNNQGLGTDSLILYMAYLAGLKEELLDNPFCLYHIDHDRRWRRMPSKNKIYPFVKNKICSRFEYDSKLRMLIRQAYLLKNRVSDFFVNIFYSLCGPFLKKYSAPEKWDFNNRYMMFDFQKTLSDMLKGKRPYAYNSADWGLPDEKFEEFTIS